MANFVRVKRTWLRTSTVLPLSAAWFCRGSAVPPSAATWPHPACHPHSADDNGWFCRGSAMFFPSWGHMADLDRSPPQSALAPTSPIAHSAAIPPRVIPREACAPHGPDSSPFHPTPHKRRSLFCHDSTLPHPTCHMRGSAGNLPRFLRYSTAVLPRGIKADSGAAAVPLFSCAAHRFFLHRFFFSLALSTHSCAGDHATDPAAAPPHAAARGTW